MSTIKFTEEQRATITQWLPFANGLTIKFLVRRPHLRHLEDELFSAARSAGVTAMQKWDASRGTYASCLAWWVRAALQEVERSAQPRHLFIGLDEPVGINKAGEFTRGWGSGLSTAAESIPDPKTPDADEASDALALGERVGDEVLPYLIGHCAAPSIQAFAKDSIALWRRNRLDGEIISDLARETGCTRQAMSQRLARVDTAVSKWAASLRKEAA